MELIFRTFASHPSILPPAREYHTYEASLQNQYRTYTDTSYIRHSHISTIHYESPNIRRFLHSIVSEVLPYKIRHFRTNIHSDRYFLLREYTPGQELDINYCFLVMEYRDIYPDNPGFHRHQNRDQNQGFRHSRRQSRSLLKYVPKDLSSQALLHNSPAS